MDCLRKKYYFNCTDPELDPCNPESCKQAHSLVLSMVNQLQEKSNEAPDFLSKSKLDQIIDNLKVSESNVLLLNV